MSPKPSSQPGRNRSALGLIRLLGLVLLGWGAWLSFPGTSEDLEREPGLTAFLLDASASATRVRTGWEVRARRAALTAATEARERGDDFMLVSYAADVQRVFGPAPAAEAVAAMRQGGSERLRLTLLPERALESRLTQALMLVAPPLLESRRGPSRLVLRSDDTYTGPDPSAQLSKLSAAGVRIELSPLEAPDQPDVALLGLEVPERLEVGALATARIEVETRGVEPAGQRARLEVEVEHSGQTVMHALDLPLGRTTRFVELGSVVAGTTEVRARVVLEQVGSGHRGDRVPENDVATAELRSRDALVCAVVSSDEASARSWLGPSPAGLEFRFVAPNALANALNIADLCVTVDVSLGELDGQLLHSFVTRGGGLLACGGWRLLRDWESERAGLVAELLPLVPDDGDLPPRDVQFVVDGSGSMSGAPFDAVREALIDLIPAAPLTDRVSLRFFVGALQPRTVLTSGRSAQRESREDRVLRLLAKTVPGGQTFLIASLEQLAKEREGATEEALVLLLSDGRETNGFKAEERAMALMQRFAETRTTLEVIAVGQEPNLRLLRALLPEGREPIRVLDLGELNEIFQRSVNRDRVESGTLALLVTRLAEQALAGGLSNALRSMQLPPIARALKTRARADATVLIHTASGNPLLGVRRTGAGVSALLATGPGESWSGELKLGTELEVLLRWLGREAHSERSSRVAVAEQLVIENARPEWPAQLTARILSADVRQPKLLGESLLGLSDNLSVGDPRSRRTGPRPSFLDSLAAGTPLVVDLVDATGTNRTSAAPVQRLALSSPGPPEFTRSTVLRSSALNAGNSMAEAAEAAEAATQVGPGAAHPWAPWLLLLGLLLLTGTALWETGMGQPR